MRKLISVSLSVAMLLTMGFTVSAEAPTPDQSAVPALVITEVAPNTKGADTFEFFELNNASGDTLNLYDYSAAYSSNTSKDPNKLTAFKAGDAGVKSTLGIENPESFELAAEETVVVWPFSADSASKKVTLTDFRDYWNLGESVRVLVLDGRSTDSERFNLPNNETSPRALHVVTNAYTLNPPAGEQVVCTAEWNAGDYGASGVGEDQGLNFTVNKEAQDMSLLKPADKLITPTPGELTAQQKANLTAPKTEEITVAEAPAETEDVPPPPDPGTAPMTIDAPDDWAMAEVTDSIVAGLVPEEMQLSYTESISRVDFCTLAVTLITVKTGKTIDKVLADKGVKINPEAFVDTNDATVLAANALGIVNGIGDGKFGLYGNITRQDAASMLMRTASVIGFTKPNSDAVEFADNDIFASYAKAAIAFISACEDKTNGKKVMGGVGENKFDPLASYTKQQAFITMIRLYNAMA